MAGALGAGQPAQLHLPTQELPAGARGSTEALAQPWCLQLSPECTNLSGNPGKPSSALPVLGTACARSLRIPAKALPALPLSTDRAGVPQLCPGVAPGVLSASAAAGRAQGGLREGQGLPPALPAQRLLSSCLPGVWKLILLISTGSLGWWGAISALFRRHLVRGSESFRLLHNKPKKKQKRPERKSRLILGLVILATSQLLMFRHEQSSHRKPKVQPKV